MSSHQLKIALGQLLVEGGEPVRNLDRAEEMIVKAAQEKCDIILLPECLDLAWTHPSVLSQKCQPIPGEYSHRLCEAAKAHNIYVCAGLTEKYKEKAYNTALFIDSKGKILSKYHKINLLNVEKPFYYVGQHLEVIDTEFGKIGINICADNYIDSLSIGHTLARMGAQIILSPSSWTVDYSLIQNENPYQEKWLKPFKILASLYNLVVVGTTGVGTIVGGPYEGKKMVGCSIAVNAQGMFSKGDYNEFAGELIIIKFEIPERKELGTDIGAMLVKKGYDLENIPF